MAWSPVSLLRDMPSLVSFRGRLDRRLYVVMQVVSAALLIGGIVLLAGSIGLEERGASAGGPGRTVPHVDGWSLGVAFGALVLSMWVGATAVTRRARDGALPAAFIGVLYIINRLNLPVTMGMVGSADMRELALLLAWIMMIVQVLLIARDTVPSGPALA